VTNMLCKDRHAACGATWCQYGYAYGPGQGHINRGSRVCFTSHMVPLFLGIQVHCLRRLDDLVNRRDVPRC